MTMPPKFAPCGRPTHSGPCTWLGTGDKRVCMAPEMSLRTDLLPELNEASMLAADLAYLGTSGERLSTAERLRLVVRAYLWADALAGDFNPQHLSDLLAEEMRG